MRVLTVKSNYNFKHLDIVIDFQDKYRSTIMTEHKKSLENSQESLLQSFNDIIDILKTIAHPNRFKILILLLTGPQAFQSLLEELKLKKSALANHLTHLKDKSLIEKVHHGTYKVTNDGKCFLQAIDTMYTQSENQKMFQQRYQPVKTFLGRKKEINEL